MALAAPVSLVRLESTRSDMPRQSDETDPEEHHDNIKRGERILGYSSSDIDAWPHHRQICFRLITHSFTDMIISTVILLNLAVMIYETDLRAGELDQPDWLRAAGPFFTTVYCIELSIRFYVFRLHFFMSTFNIMDFLIVATDLVFELLSSFLGANMPNVTMLRILRVLRALRFVRAIRSFVFFRELYMIMNGFFSAMKAIVWATILLLAVLLLWSLLAVEAIHPIVKKMSEDGKFEDCDRCERSYSSVMHAMLTFTQQVVALDAWSEPTIPVIEMHPWTVLVFGAVLVTVNLGLMNLILSVIVGKAQQARQEDVSFKVQEKEEEGKKLKKEHMRVCAELDTDGSGTLSLEELLNGFDENSDFQMELASMDIQRNDLESLFPVLDDDGSGEVDYNEFIDQLHKTKTSESQVVVVFIRAAIQDLSKDIRSAQGRIDKVVERTWAYEKSAEEILRLVGELSERRGSSSRGASSRGCTARGSARGGSSSRGGASSTSFQQTVYSSPQSVGGGCCGSSAAWQQESLDKFQDTGYSDVPDEEVKALREKVAQMRTLVANLPGAQLEEGGPQ